MTDQNLPHPVEARCRLGPHFCNNPAKAPGELCWFHKAPRDPDLDIRHDGEAAREARLAGYREAAGTS